MVTTRDGKDSYMHQTLCELNAEALRHYKATQYAEAATVYNDLFRKVKKENLTHAELYNCYNNCAAALLQLEQYDAALQHAECARKLAEQALHRTPKAFQPHVKALSRKANALIGLGRYREASMIAEEGLKLDPFDLALKQASEVATKGILKDLLEGKGKEILALPNAEPTQRITYHPHSAPLHKIKTDNMLPAQLLTPFQAESDHHVRDTYNYVTVMTDIAMPKRHMAVLQDQVRQDAWAAAIASAVAATMADDKECRVLDLGAGSGLHTMMALHAGASHVTAVERWLYLSLACKQTLQANGFHADAYKVIYKRPTDLALQHDVPNFCNLLLCDILDEGLLASGIIPAVRHCLDKLLTTEARIIPASATVFCQAAAVHTGKVCGLDMRGIDRHRWHTSHTAGIPLADGMFEALSEPREVWHFDMLAPPEESGRKSLDLTFTRDGTWNAVVFWYELHLTQDITLCTGPAGIGSGMKTLCPAVQYLAGEISVEAGNVLPLLATHNTVRMRFYVEETEYLHLAKPDAAFPALHFSMLADAKRNEAYDAAIARAITQKKAATGSAHVIDMGTGAGLFALMAARNGADSVIAYDLHETLCSVASKNVAANGFSDKVSVVHRDVGLERGQGARRLGANVVIADMLDAGLLGNGFLHLLEQAKRNVLQPDTAVVPCGATLYVMGIHVPPTAVASYDMSAMDQYRWDKSYESCELDKLPHTCLTKPCKALEFFFEGDSKGRGRDNIMKLEVIAAGLMNAVAFWFDLHLDEQVSLCTGPSYVRLGGAVDSSTKAVALANTSASESGSTPAPAQTGEAIVSKALDVTEHRQGLAQVQPSNDHVASNTISLSSSPAKSSAPTWTEVAAASSNGKQLWQRRLEGTSAEAPCAVSAADVQYNSHDLMVRIRDQISCVAGICIEAIEPSSNSSSRSASSSSNKPARPDCSAANSSDSPDKGLVAVSPPTGNSNAEQPAPSRQLDTAMCCTASDDKSYLKQSLTEADEPTHSFCTATDDSDHLKQSLPEADYSTPSLCTAPDDTYHLKQSSAVASNTAPIFQPADQLCGARPGFVFKLGDQGLGYYTDAPEHTVLENRGEAAAHVITKSGEATAHAIAKSGGARHDHNVGTAEGGSGVAEGSGGQHYWGQALQYLDSSLQVQPGKKVLLLAKREGTQVRFSLRAGVGSPVAIAPWKMQWGGGASVENPHYQRVHYCDLLVQDFLQRVGGGRFPSIEKDMQMVQAHCGSLFLDPAELAKIYHELVLLERMHKRGDCGPGASLQALTAPPLQLH